MTIEQAIYAILAGNAGVHAIAADRISPSSRLQGTALPAVVYQVQAIEPIRGLGGPAGLSSATIEATAIADTYAAAKSLLQAVITAVNGAAGTYSGTTVASIHYTSQAAADFQPGEGEEDLPAELSATFAAHYQGT
jgi:hypothetical protein